MVGESVHDARHAHIWAPELPGTSAWLVSQIRARRFVGAQVYVWQAGDTLADFGIGLARPGSPMTSTTLNYWFCCAKPLMAIATAQLVEKGSLCLDDRVCEIIPSFRSGGKDAITVRHLLTHTAGFRDFKDPRPFLASDREIVKAVCASTIRDHWKPGERAAYTPFASWYILGELVQQLTGELIPSYVARHIFEPLGLNRCWLGMPPDVALTERPHLSIPHAITSGSAPVPIHFLGSPTTLQLVNGASGAIGPISGLGRIFQSLLHPEGSACLLSPQTVREFVTPQRIGLIDETYQLRWDWGLGFAVDLARLCPAAGREGFGHPGGSTLVMANRAVDRVVAVAVNGLSAWNGAPEVGPGSAVAGLAGEIYRDLDTR